jgi:hypothetical protein
LLALFYLKKYLTKHALIAAFLDRTEKTVLAWAMCYVKAIQALKEKKVNKCFHL